MLRLALGIAISCASAMPFSQTAASEPLDDRQIEAAVVAHNRHAREEDQIVCTRERRIGSHVLRRVCRSRAQIERESAASEWTLAWPPDAPLVETSSR